MSQRDLALSIQTALAKSVRDVTRYEATRERLGNLLGVPKEDVSVKVVGDVAADFKNRVGEVTGRRNTRFIAVLLGCDSRSLAEEIERATEQTKQVTVALGFTGSLLLFGDVPGQGWSLQRIIETGSDSNGSEQLIDSLSLSPSIVVRLSRPPGGGGGHAGDAWLEFTYSGHEHGGAGWEFGTSLWSPVTDKDGKNRYGVMERPQVGDTIVHCSDSVIVGESRVRKQASKTTKEPPKSGRWGGRGNYYRIDLEQYEEYALRIRLDAFLTRYAKDVMSELSDRPKYYPFTLYGEREIRVPEGAYLSKLTPLLLSRIREAAQTAEPSATPPVTTVRSSPYITRMPHKNDLFLDPDEFQEMQDVLLRQKNVILQGPPGVGKSYVAKRLTYALIGEHDPVRSAMVQFHQSYSYEDFIQGWRPKESGGFVLRNGPFLEFCERASGTPKPAVLVIDEINRGNVSRIFGELMLLIEADKRTPDFALPLAYAEPASPAARFWVPESVHLIGLMNTADRSLAMVDYALRRRFSFFDLKPAFSRPQFRVFLLKCGASESLVTRIVERMTELNETIAGDLKNLGPGFAIGHSFFCPRESDQPGEEWYNRVVTYEIAPLLREYYFDDAERADSLIARLA